jgi:hypothetical protein
LKTCTHERSAHPSRKTGQTFEFLLSGPYIFLKRLQRNTEAHVSIDLLHVSYLHVRRSEEDNFSNGQRPNLLTPRTHLGAIISCHSFADPLVDAGHSFHFVSPAASLNSGPSRRNNPGCSGFAAHYTRVRNRAKTGIGLARAPPVKCLAGFAFFIFSPEQRLLSTPLSILGFS